MPYKGCVPPHNRARPPLPPRHQLRCGVCRFPSKTGPRKGKQAKRAALPPHDCASGASALAHGERDVTEKKKSMIADFPAPPGRNALVSGKWSRYAFSRVKRADAWKTRVKYPIAKARGLWELLSCKPGLEQPPGLRIRKRYAEVLFKNLPWSARPAPSVSHLAVKQENGVYPVPS